MINDAKMYDAIRPIRFFSVFGTFYPFFGGKSHLNELTYEEANNS